jgi:hypothetical protein
MAKILRTFAALKTVKAGNQMSMRPKKLVVIRLGVQTIDENKSLREVIRAVKN